MMMATTKMDETAADAAVEDLRAAVAQARANGESWGTSPRSRPGGHLGVQPRSPITGR